jgi:large subunit ribosomal protein L29
MKASELRQMESSELLELLEKQRDELFKDRLNWASGTLENPGKIRNGRHAIARILTVLRQRELARQIAELEAKQAQQGGN